MIRIWRKQLRNIPSLTLQRGRRAMMIGGQSTLSWQLSGSREGNMRIWLVGGQKRDRVWQRRLAWTARRTCIVAIWSISAKQGGSNRTSCSGGSLISTLIWNQIKKSCYLMVKGLRFPNKVWSSSTKMMSISGGFRDISLVIGILGMSMDMDSQFQSLE